MAEEVSIISSCSGLNTVVDPIMVANSTDKQLATMLSKCMNVVISDNHKIELTKGFVKLSDLTNGHSLFCDGGSCLVHDGGSMYEVNTNLTLSAAKRTGMSGDKINHVQFGQAIYFGNRIENGTYYGNTALSWLLDTYTGPPTERIFEETVPLFDHIAAFNGHMLGSIDNALFASEPGKPGLWDSEPIWITDTKILMIKPVVNDAFPPSGGIFISDEKRQVFLGGLNLRELTESRLTNYPAIEWSVAHGLLDATMFSEMSGLVGVWQSSEGLCIGFPSGKIFNATQKTINIPSGYVSGATLISGTNIISTLR